MRVRVFSSLNKLVNVRNRFVFRTFSSSTPTDPLPQIAKKPEAPSVKVDLEAIQNARESKLPKSEQGSRPIDLKIDQSEKFKPHGNLFLEKDISSIDISSIKKKSPLSEFESYLHNTILVLLLERNNK